MEVKMAEKLLKETKDTQTKRKKTKKVAEEDDIYKIDLTLESPENEDDFKAKDLESEEKEEAAPLSIHRVRHCGARLPAADFQRRAVPG